MKFAHTMAHTMAFTALSCVVLKCICTHCEAGHPPQLPFTEKVCTNIGARRSRSACAYLLESPTKEGPCRSRHPGLTDSENRQWHMRTVTEHDACAALVCGAPPVHFLASSADAFEPSTASTCPVQQRSPGMPHCLRLESTTWR